MMSDVFYLRAMDPPATRETVLESRDYAGGCFDLHRVNWVHSFLAADGGRMLCWYLAPDAESARLALRELGSDMSAVWPGHVLGGVEARDAAVSQVDVLAEVPLGESYEGDDEELLQRLGSATTADGTVAFRFAFVASRRDRMVCLFDAGDAETARVALEKAGLPAEAIWPCTVVTP
jgi:hypothetical protein